MRPQAIPEGWEELSRWRGSERVFQAEGMWLTKASRCEPSVLRAWEAFMGGAGDRSRRPLDMVGVWTLHQEQQRVTEGWMGNYKAMPAF